MDLLRACEHFMMQQSGIQFLGREEEAKAVAPEVEGVVTLLIRHLPEAIPHDTLSRLFSNYGAFSVRPCSAPQLRNCAFLDFKNEALAYQAFRQLNGLRFLDKVLSVERASNEPIVDTKLKKSEAHMPPTSTSMFKDATKHTILGSTPASEPIAPRLGVEYPFPPHLEYVYPPPDGNILTNIVNALIAVPRFYTQEIDGETYLIGASTVKKFSRKRRKQEAIVGPAVDKDVAHEAVGLKPATLVPKEIPMIKKKNPVLQIKIAPKVIQNEHRDDTTSKELEEPDKEGLDIKPYATSEELESGKLPPEEILSLPMFKNYTAGNPTSVLYVKNLAKDVVANDFYFIFGSLFGSVDATKSGLSVKLMQEGRMRGQAFVTFPSVELAHRALNLVNGYVFKGKPMIIQFGRNLGAGKTN
ncbi:U11/U12 small nuclear ribonucleoprotein 65 kDa protein isoform X7 [Juglans regia]|uniref:U11/U12 small nuclear ribonucleoprotein 65 kDa protein isoform X7 n=1 Tax=Juglans regia TaxID=51240 RepID=A0A6P9ES86_JUGRE|nr:U11/U12 small nuclear ribonucleoprotein 65 kDa protein isoform X7 [Juglans regia]